jgi:hypothetical protein
MTINLQDEIAHITDSLKLEKGYLACEQIITNNIKKHLELNCGNLIIKKYLAGLSNHFLALIEVEGDGAECINYRYARGAINILLKYWPEDAGIAELRLFLPDRAHNAEQDGVSFIFSAI